LQLPLHLPLYHYLMRAAAVACHDESLVETSLEISSWMVTSLDVPVMDSHLFAPALRKLVRNQSFPQVVDLLIGMRYLHDVRYLQVGLTSELLLLLGDIAQRHHIINLAEKETSSGRRRKQESKAMEKKIVEGEICRLISLLEPSITFYLQRHTDLLEESLRHDMNALIDGMDAPQVAEVLKLFEASMEADTDTDSDCSDNDDEEEGVDEVFESPDGELVKLDLMTDLPASGKARQLLLELMKISDDMPARTLRRPIDPDDSDESVCPSRSFLYMRERGDPSNAFPDVTSQFVKLNAGGPIMFSSEYENLLLQSEFEDLDLFDSFAGDTDSDSDSDDDGSDDF
jgi:hypothetical protein